jgi:hypothetical protein
MFLKYSQCFVLLTLYSPILHHVVKPRGTRKPNAYAYGWKCVDAAMNAVCIAEAMAEQDMLHEAYTLTLDVLVMAATALLVVELGDPDNGMADRVRKSSRKAKTLLKTLGPKNRSAAVCLESLMVSSPFVQHEDETIEDLASLLACIADRLPPASLRKCHLHDQVLDHDSGTVFARLQLFARAQQKNHGLGASVRCRRLCPRARSNQF